jgi:hypothetical protein
VANGSTAPAITITSSGGTVTSIVFNAPLSGGTVTTTGTVGITGAAGEMLAGSTPAFTATPALGTDNSVAGTLQFSNGSANAHTTLGSVATTSNTVDFFTTAPTTGDLVDCVVSTTTCTLTDSAVLAANVATNSSNYPSNSVIYATGNHTQAGSANLTWSSPTLTVGASGTAGAIAEYNNTATTTWKSGATTSNTIAGFTVAPTTTDLIACTTISTTCTLTDSGIPDTAAGILAACTGCAPLVSPSLTTPALGAATATSLLASGIVDGLAPMTITTGSSATLGAGTYQSGYTFNQEGAAGTGVTYTLPTTVKGMQYCVFNSGTTSIVNIGVLTVYPASGSYVIYKGVVNTVGGGGTHGIASNGAAGDGACFLAIDSTHWLVSAISGTLTEN